MQKQNMNTEFLKEYFNELQKIMMEQKDYLIKLDSVIGDGDLGLTMSDGFSAAYNNVKNSEESDCGVLLYMAGKSMCTAVPSTMGTLMGSGWIQAGKKLRGIKILNNDDLITLFSAFEEGVIHRGKAKVGDKTFLDGLHPAIESLKINIIKDPIKKCAIEAYKASENGYQNTSGMLAIHGRAALRGEKGRKLKDPGAYVATLIMKAFKNLF